MPGNSGRADIKYLPENGSHAFLFQPKGLVQFKTAWNWQSDWRTKLLADPSSPQAVWLLEHSSCYTIGRGGNKENVLFDINNAPAEFHCIDRGGDATHHLQGQLVVYLVIDLRKYKLDLHWYLRELEQVLIDLLEVLDLSGERIEGLTGLWCKGLKVASIGVGCRRWVTQHGFALNVNCDLKGFEEIFPCGLNSSKVGTLNDFIPGITVREVQPLVKKCLTDRFRFDWVN